MRASRRKWFRTLMQYSSTLWKILVDQCHQEAKLDMAPWSGESHLRGERSCYQSVINSYIMHFPFYIIVLPSALPQTGLASRKNFQSSRGIEISSRGIEIITACKSHDVKVKLVSRLEFSIRDMPLGGRHTLAKIFIGEQLKVPPVLVHEPYPKV